ncbi:AAA family ATPase [Variovorax sp. LjRoot130]|uniref:AAA family ATPase n=1 Tax=Variovorax sp. LjRoot130 TaxID=3342261 RepID=UPI003ECCAF0F
MLRQLQHIKNMGVFGNYTRDPQMTEFRELNIIYGWNYSGKTTISRLFGLLESKKPNSDFPAAKFAFGDEAGTITEQSFQANTELVRVFNSDFVQENLSWVGDPFNPILIVGKEAIEAEKTIEGRLTLHKRCTEGEARKRKAFVDLDRAKNKSLTDGAAAIKTALSLVKAFYSTHLENVLTTVRAQGREQCELTPEAYESDLKLAQMPDGDRLPELPALSYDLKLDQLHGKTGGLLSQQPAFSNVIEYLKNNPDVSNWVEQGLPLHEHKANCEFCGSAMPPGRLDQLRAHFSKDMATQKEALQDLLGTVQASRIAHQSLRPVDFFNRFRKQVADVYERLPPQLKAYNAELDKIAIALQRKIQSAFDTPEAPILDATVELSLRDSVAALDDLIKQHNTVSINFLGEKNAAIERLKQHHAVLFERESELLEKEARLKLLEKHQQWFRTKVGELETEIKILRAKINLAQKGREAINQLIEQLLGSDIIQIEVLKVGDVDRFQLTRKGGAKAMHLSEGERTAVAFAFFMTKLDEIKLEDAIVYIDDPISSLDSNHIYQFAGLVKSKFLTQDPPFTGEWKMKCKQLFISTHNFEFFSLLRELKLNGKKRSHFMVKRLTPSASTFGDLPRSIDRYASEYHYLFSVIHGFYIAPKKDDVEVLLSLPNAVRRFFELYTYSKYPGEKEHNTIDQRAERIWGDRASGVLKVFHYFSHGQNMERMASNNDMICNIEKGVSDLIELLKEDELHFAALKAAL